MGRHSRRFSGRPKLETIPEDKVAVGRLFWACFFLLVLIHTFDMEVTYRCIGNCWEMETFLPMSTCIRYLGIMNAIWVSRLIMYPYFWVCVHFRRLRWIRTTMGIITLLYWASMLNWPFLLGWIPSP